MDQERAAILRNRLDFIERAVMALLFSGMLYRLLPHFATSGDIVDIGVLISDGASTFFVLTHRKTSTLSLSLPDWGLTAAATVLPTLVVPSSTDPVLPLLIRDVLLAHGFVLHIATKLTLRRSFGLVPANRGVKIGGPYRLLRHPMYAG